MLPTHAYMIDADSFDNRYGTRVESREGSDGRRRKKCGNSNLIWNWSRGRKEDAAICGSFFLLGEAKALMQQAQYRSTAQ